MVTRALDENGRVLIEFYTPPFSTMHYQLPRMAMVAAIECVNDSTPPPDYRSLYEEAERKLDAIRAAGGWYERSFSDV